MVLYSKKKKSLKNNQKKPSSVHLFHMVKTQTHINSTTRYNHTQTDQQDVPSSPTSLPHLAVLFLFFYTSDVQNVIAPVGRKHTC